MDPHEHDNKQNSRSRSDGAESRFKEQSLVKKWHVADPKNNFFIFCENSIFLIFLIFDF
jgi:hypothetical protein